MVRSKLSDVGRWPDSTLIEENELETANIEHAA